VPIAEAQLASACQSGIRKRDATAGLLSDEAGIDQSIKGRDFALVGSTASPAQSDAAHQFGQAFIPRRHEANICAPSS
jgi:hypothetical protein